MNAWMCVIYEKMLPLSSKLSFNEDFKQSISNKNLDISLTENDEQVQFLQYTNNSTIFKFFLGDFFTKIIE